MGDRLMELICMFDLPVLTARNRRAYRQFKKFLDKMGFVMLEESVYCRMIPNGATMKSTKAAFREHRPPSGLVALLVVTEKQFANMEFITGKHVSNVLSSMDSVAVI